MGSVFYCPVLRYFRDNEQKSVKEDVFGGSNEEKEEGKGDDRENNEEK